MKISDTVLKMTEVTHGRIHPQQVFYDFLAYAALTLSNRTDPVHLEDRKERQNKALKEYRPQEVEVLSQTLQLLAKEIAQNLERGVYVDLLGRVHQRLHPKSGPLKQDFTPPDVASILARITAGQLVLPEAGYFTFMEPTCGSGVLCLAYADEVARQGYNPCEQLVIQASDLDSQCVHMAYLQLSLYGIPAVIIHGNALSLVEYDRWYTPLYIWRKWVWREPMSFKPGRNESDERLKIASDPVYAQMRAVEAFIRKNYHYKEDGHG